MTERKASAPETIRYFISYRHLEGYGWVEFHANSAISGASDLDWIQEHIAKQYRKKSTLILGWQRFEEPGHD